VVDPDAPISAEEHAKDVDKMLASTGLMRQGGEPTCRFLATGTPDEFESIGWRFLDPETVAAPQVVGGVV
jgi:glutamate racemase